MKLTAPNIFALLRTALLAFSQDKAARMAAALSYQSMFALAPMLFLVLAVAAGVLTNVDVQKQLFQFLSQNLSESAATFVQGIIPSGNKLQQSSLVASLLGFGTLFMGSTSLFVQLQDSLNTLWGAEPGPGQGLLNTLKTRLISFLMILLIGVVVIGFLVGNIYLTAAAQQLGAQFGLGAVFARLATFAVGVGLLTLVFAAIYKWLPSVHLEWREVWFGAALTALLFTLGQLLISWYLGRFAPGSAFGAAGALVVLLVWMNYSAMIFFFGAELTWVYSQKHGRGAGGAASVTKKEELISKGAALNAAPSPQEHEGLRRAAEAGKPVPRSFAVHLAEYRASQQIASQPLHASKTTSTVQAEPPTPVPSLAGALWGAVTAVLALPAVLILNLTQRLNRNARPWAGAKRGAETDT